jgi:hypothetical protein
MKTLPRIAVMIRRGYHGVNAEFPGPDIPVTFATRSSARRYVRLVAILTTSSGRRWFPG